MRFICFIFIFVMISGRAYADLQTYCVTPVFNKFYIDQRVAVFTGKINTIRPAEKDDFDGVHPADMEGTLRAELTVLKIEQDRFYHDLEKGKPAYLAFPATEGAALVPGQTIIVFADRGYDKNRFWVGRCNPTLTGSYRGLNIKGDSYGRRVLKSIID